MANPGATPDPTALAKPDVTGAYCGAIWASIETSRGNYSGFATAVDACVKAAETAGKKVMLAFDAGPNTPSWIYNAPDSVTSIQVIWPLNFGPTMCSAIKEPQFWNANYLARYKLFIQAMAAHRYTGQVATSYGSDPNIVNVRPAGINWTSPETFLPSNFGAQTISGCANKSNDDFTSWKNIGYTRALLRSANTQIINEVMTDFPFASVGQSYNGGGNGTNCTINNPSGFPALDDNGNQITNPTNTKWDCCESGPGGSCNGSGGGGVGGNNPLTTNDLAQGYDPLRLTFQSDGGNQNANSIQPWCTANLTQHLCGMQEANALGQTNYANLATLICGASGTGVKWYQVYPTDITGDVSGTTHKLSQCLLAH